MNRIAAIIESKSADEVVIVIDGTRIEQFSNFSILFSIDNVGTGFSFSSPFFPETKQYRDLFRPKSYHPTQIYIGGNLVFNGRMEFVSPENDGISTKVSVQGRSITAIIIDCTFEKDDFSGSQFIENGLQFKGADLQEIAASVVKKFGIDVAFPDGAGAIFETASPDNPTTVIFDFLQNLARQRKLLIGQNNFGELLFRRAKTTGTPIAELIEGQQGMIISTASYDGTKRFSEYNAFGQQYGKADNFALVEDSTIPILRPKSINSNDTNAGNIKDSAEWSLSSDIANSINIPLSYEGWLTPDGDLWKENELIIIHAPSLMIYQPYTMLIKSVNLRETDTEKITDIIVTIPEAYTGEIPERFPWDE